MATHYGPWAALIDAGGNPQLSSFWRRRLTMLVPTSQTSPILSRRNLLWLGVAGALMLVLPTFRPVPATADEAKPVKSPKDFTPSAPLAIETGKSARTSVTLEKSPQKTWTLPDGRILIVGGGLGTTISSGDPKTIETVKRRHEEMKPLIAQKKYKFVRAFTGPLDEKQYVYTFTYPDGSQMNTNFPMRLEGVVSWDDYQRKKEEQENRRRDQISKAIAAGRFRLLNLDVIQVHICREVDSNQKLNIQRIPIADGKVFALFRPFGVKGEEQATTTPETSWDDHLAAIRNGRRELLSMETTTTYIYEMVLDDGSKTIFNYGGGEPLKKPEKVDYVVPKSK